jgi:hypothetical protein
LIVSSGAQIGTDDRIVSHEVTSSPLNRDPSSLQDIGVVRQLEGNFAVLLDKTVRQQVHLSGAGQRHQLTLRGQRFAFRQIAVTDYALNVAGDLLIGAAASAQDRLKSMPG